MIYFLKIKDQRAKDKIRITFKKCVEHYVALCDTFYISGMPLITTKKMSYRIHLTQFSLSMSYPKIDTNEYDASISIVG
jgi:hypothetical protein